MFKLLFLQVLGHYNWPEHLESDFVFGKGYFFNYFLKIPNHGI